jgi:hypothetical protein
MGALSHLKIVEIGSAATVSYCARLFADFDLDHIRSDLAELIARHAITLDENRRRWSRAGARPISERRGKTSRNWSMTVRSSDR